MGCKNTAKSGTAYITSNDIRMGIKIALCITERPPAAAGQWRMLTEESDGFKPRLFTIPCGTATARSISDRLAGGYAIQPFRDRTKMTAAEPGYAMRRDVALVKQRYLYPLTNSVGCAGMHFVLWTITKTYRSLLHAHDDAVEVFLNPFRRSGSDRLILDSPSLPN